MGSGYGPDIAPTLPQCSVATLLWPSGTATGPLIRAWRRVSASSTQIFRRVYLFSLSARQDKHAWVRSVQSHFNCSARMQPDKSLAEVRRRLFGTDSPGGLDTEELLAAADRHYADVTGHFAAFGGTARLLVL